MPLESCMILLDNSEYMRNSDYLPTRLRAQQDAANLLVDVKTQSHPESTVGVSAGSTLLVSPTTEVGKILGALRELSYSSTSTSSSSTSSSSAQEVVTASMQVASLALKHRRNKNGSQRIVLFVGSPLSNVEGKALAKAGRQLKKNNVAIDVVLMGELQDNEDKLKELVDAANGRVEEGGERTCHLVTIPPGVLPSDVLASSPVLHGGEGGSAFAASAAAGAASAGGGGGDAFMDFGGVDPNMDPELAMALRVSMEEERARQERLAAQQAADQANEGEGATGGDAEMTEAASAATANPADAAAAAAMDMGLSEEEALLQQALAMSMNENEPSQKGAPSQAKSTGEDDNDDDEEAAAMQLALQMSMQADNQESGGDNTKQQEFQDPQFVNQLLGSLPGVNPNDPAVQRALSNLQQQKDDGDGKKKEDGDKKGDDNEE